MATALYRFPTLTNPASSNDASDTTDVQPLTTTPLNELEQISLAPLSAGDIIDRAVRLYRLQLLAFLRIVLPPTLLAYAGGILWTIGWRNISFEHGDRRMFLMSLSALAGGLMWLIGKAGFLMVLGAASRALVFHFFNGTPVLARDVYRAVRERIWGLLGATVLLSFSTLALIFMGYTIFAMIFMVYFIAVMALTQILPGWLMGTMHFVFGLAVAALLIAGGLVAYARVVYTPQAMMVEGKGVFDAFGRSFTLAGREYKRIGAVLLFQVCVAWSLYALLLVPLGWYSYFNEDISLSGFFNSSGPLWFSIAQQTLTQLGEILIAPIVLLSFTLLYLDSRVRKEGFDVELLANRILPPARYEMRTAPPVAPAPTPSVPLRDIDWSSELAENAPPVTPPPVEMINSARVPPLEAVHEIIAPAALPAIETIHLSPVNAPPSATATMARCCSACGTAVNQRARFCPACGEKL